MNDPQKLWNKCLNEMKEIMKEQNNLTIPDLFKAEDFPGFILSARNQAAEFANARFKEIASTWPIRKWHEGFWQKGDEDNRIALLAFPQEIKKAECEHSILQYPNPMPSMPHPVTTAKCGLCGKALVAKWEVAK